jgi:hypothetical protein
VCDLSDYSLREKLGMIDKETFFERVRKTIVSSMKIGQLLAFYLDKTSINLPNFFREA